MARLLVFYQNLRVLKGKTPVFDKLQTAAYTFGLLTNIAASL